MDDGDSSASAQTTAPRAGTQCSRLVVEIVEDDGDWDPFAAVEDLVTRAAEAVALHREVAFEASSATVALSSDAGVKGLNAAYRGKDKPTNVLSFPAPPGLPAEGGRVFLGDVVLAAETVAQEARELGIPPGHHLQHLVVHGILHLMGYDHETDEDAETMEALETRILASIGIADPYGDSRT